MIKKKLMKNAHNSMVKLRKQQKNLRIKLVSLENQNVRNFEI